MFSEFYEILKLEVLGLLTSGSILAKVIRDQSYSALLGLTLTNFTPFCEICVVHNDCRGSTSPVKKRQNPPENTSKPIINKRSHQWFIESIMFI